MQYRVQFDGHNIRFNNIQTKQPDVDLKLSKWIINTPLTVAINGDVLTNYGRGGWVELAYIPFTVEANGTYDIVYDYYIQNATCGSHGAYGFGIWLTENEPLTAASFYTDSTNRMGSVLIEQNETVTNKSGNVSYQVTLVKDQTYYLWFPGGALNDGKPFQFKLTNIKCVPVSTDFVPETEDGNIGYTVNSMPSGTYYTTLYDGSPSAYSSAGTLTDSISNYDVIKFYGMPQINNANDASGSQQPALACPTIWMGNPSHSAHLQFAGLFVSGTTTFIGWADSVVCCPTESSFAQNKWGNAFRATTTANTTATWNYGNSAAYTNLYRTVNKIEGIKYSGTRDLLFSSTNGASAGVLTSGGSNYYMLQAEVGLSGNDNGNGRYIVEFRKSNDGSGRNTLAIPYGGGGNWYRGDAMVRWSDDTHFTIPSAKTLYKSTTTTANMAANTSYSNAVRNSVHAIWGIKW